MEQNADGATTDTATVADIINNGNEAVNADTNGNVTTTEATTEAGCKHNWIAETKVEYVPLRDDNICKYCGYTTSDINDIINHCSLCSGVWTHEELISAGYTEEDTAYKVSVGTAKGTTYTTKTIYDTVEVGTGLYYCDKCWTTK